MFFITLIIVLIGLLAAPYCLSCLKEYLRYRRLITSLHGPKSNPFLGNLSDLNCDDATLFTQLRQWAQEYYPAYKISAGLYLCVNIVSPEDFEVHTECVLSESVTSVSNRSTMDSAVQSSKWQTRRKILTPAFHFSILQQFVTIFNNETEHLVEVFRKNCHKPYINVVPYISQFTLSTINETSMGTRLNMDDEEDKTYYSTTHQIGKIFLYRLLRPWFYNNVFFYNLTPVGRKEKKLVNILHHFTSKVIKNKAKNFEEFEVNENEEINYSKRKKLAMLDLLLNAKISDGLIDDKGIEDEVNTFMFEELILQEINQVLNESNSQPSYNELQELKYMERCIKESLRIYPSVPFTARVLEEDILTSNGYTLPKSTIVNIHIFDIHRNPKIWPDPEKFDPDRFLPENCQNRHPFSFVPFSAGPRNCIGQKFAILELKAALCGIIRNFLLEPVDTPENIVLVTDMVLRAENDTVRVKFTPRN
ncbi:hypothetical protein NQ314_020000 [Rhamnusium bicolor]|uniref:Cytochrome P450 n=1 Tax=Rhamnusium bicolor TaxID=1586634 RepID=A0AAV8WL54_9CUCU|nr:hypothetical protein NQ314_020000 [Rhamnusium bicolor]